jgi:hypothetical protein
LVRLPWYRERPKWRRKAVDPVLARKPGRLRHLREAGGKTRLPARPARNRILESLGKIIGPILRQNLGRARRLRTVLPRLETVRPILPAIGAACGFNASAASKDGVRNSSSKSIRVCRQRLALLRSSAGTASNAKSTGTLVSGSATVFCG